MSDAQGAEPKDGPISGRCYCGATTFRAARPPLRVAYCHCADCRRSTGAPVAAFACFEEGDVTFAPSEGRRAAASSGVKRTFCPSCGSPLSGRYDYLPGQVYVPLGLIDQAADLPPGLHAHASERLPWLHIADELERFGASSRSRLAAPEESDDR